MNTAKQQQQPDLDVYAIPVSTDLRDDRTGKNTDLSTFQMLVAEESHALNQTGYHVCNLLECRYGWCACFVITQIESRIGMASYNAALGIRIGALVLMLVPTLVCLVWTILVATDSTDVSSPFTMICCIATAAVLIVTAFVLFLRMVAMRSAVRKMFQIPEGTFTDCYAMRQRHNIRALRQMALHLKIDQAGMFDRVDTLPAYQS